MGASDESSSIKALYPSVSQQLCVTFEASVSVTFDDDDDDNDAVTFIQLQPSLHASCHAHVLWPLDYNNAVSCGHL